MCWGPSALSYRRHCPSGVLRRCPTDACVPAGSRGVVLIWAPRGDCFPCVSGVTGARLGTQRGNHMETVVGGTWKPNGNHVETSWKPRGNHMDFEMRRFRTKAKFMQNGREAGSMQVSMPDSLGPGARIHGVYLSDSRSAPFPSVSCRRQGPTDDDDGDDSRPTTSTIDDDGRPIDDRRSGVAHRRIRAQSARLSMGRARDRVGATQRCPRRVPRGSRAGKPSEHCMLEN